MIFWLCSVLLCTYKSTIKINQKCVLFDGYGSYLEITCSGHSADTLPYVQGDLCEWEDNN